MVRGLTVTADYYHINVTNTIQGAGTQNILNACYPGTGATHDPVLCTQVHRDPVTGMISVVDDYTANLGSLTTAGIDLSARYTMPTTDFGRFGFLFDANYLIQQDQYIFSLIQGAGNFDLGVNPRIKFNAGVQYQLAGLSAGVLGRFIGGHWAGPAQHLSPPRGLVSQPSPSRHFAHHPTRPIS